MKDLDEQIGADIVAKVWLPLFTQPVLYLIVLYFSLLTLLCSECSIYDYFHVKCFLPVKRGQLQLS